MNVDLAGQRQVVPGAGYRRLREVQQGLPLLLLLISSLFHLDILSFLRIFDYSEILIYVHGDALALCLLLDL